MYASVLRPLLFRLEAERAHELGVDALRLLGRLGPVCRGFHAWHRWAGGWKPVRLFGVDFPNRIGLAAGFDKDGLCWRGASALGFGHVEIGTITAQRQPGNKRPRVFRLPEDNAVVNRMGFNNAGAEAVAARLEREGRGRRAIPLGINIGKSFTTPLDRAAEDYLASFRLLAPHADYVAVNVSSPNTPDLRKLQEETRLAELLRGLVAENAALAARPGGRRVPLLVKIAPDMTFRQVDGILATVLDLRLDGIIATNTTIERPRSLRGAAASEAGGLSGAPLRRRATEFVRYLALATQGRLPIIGVGGVDDPEGVGEKLDAGASLVQVYTGMIYRGPFLAARLAGATPGR